MRRLASKLEEESGCTKDLIERLNHERSVEEHCIYGDALQQARNLLALTDAALADDEVLPSTVLLYPFISWLFESNFGFVMNTIDLLSWPNSTEK